MAVMTTSTLSDIAKTYYDKKLLKWTMPRLLHDKYAQKSQVPKGSKTYEWRRYDKIAQLASPEAAWGSSGNKLSEGVLPLTLRGPMLTDGSGNSDSYNGTLSIAVTLVTKTPDQFGALAVGTDVVDTVSIDPVLDITTERLAQHAAEAIDRITRASLIAGGTVQYAGPTATNADEVTATDYINYAEIVEALGTLKTNLAEPAENGNWGAIISVGTWQRLIQDPDFREAVVFGQKDNMFTGKLGTFMGVNFYETTIGYSTAEDLTTVHHTLIFGKEAYGTISWAGMGLESIYTPPGGQSDPFKQVWKMAWKTSHAVVILNALFYLRLVHAV